MADRIEELSEVVMSSTTRIKSTLSNNVRILKATGATGAQLAALMATVKRTRTNPVAPIAMPPVRDVPPHMSVSLGDMQGDIDGALPPRGDHESDADFHRRGNAMLDRKTRSAASFIPAGFQDTRTQPASIMKTARFADNSSASSAGGINGGRWTPAGFSRDADIAPVGYNQSISGYITSSDTPMNTQTAFEVFMMEKGEEISRLIRRQLGVAMEAPPRGPRPKDPPLYDGEDSDEKFMNWFGSLCTWLQAYSMGGPKYEENRILYFKTSLGSHAREWFNSDVEPDRGESDIPRTFEAIARAMYRRFVTSATAMRATKEYEAVRYDAVRGIDYLVNELARTSKRMREPPSEFSIRQRFMRLIPPDIHNELIKVGLQPEYANLTILKNHARAAIEAKGQMRGGTTTSAVPATTTARAIGGARTRAPARAPRSEFHSNALAFSHATGRALRSDSHGYS
ncbi:hypothetical protein DFH06DRAFT_1351179 [Mycena polygramma]|nr:hypothetical protein DFH06DRAFT_1351179 [Mycena polygramma]